MGTVSCGELLSFRVINFIDSQCLDMLPLHAAGGAKNINFQELAADLAQITYSYPFEIPPYFGESLHFCVMPCALGILHRVLSA